MHEYAIFAKATTHWLRHTSSTRATAREMMFDMIQAQIGYAKIQTTAPI